MSWRQIVPWVLVATAMIAGCAPAEPEQGGRSDAELPAYSGAYPIRAIATVGMVADLVRRVGGEQVEVTALMGPGVDPHLYKATRDDVQTILGGDIIFYCGLMLEGRMSDTLRKIGRRKPVVPVAERFDRSLRIGSAGHADPHVWMDVSLWSRCLDVVTDTLVRFDPKNAEAYRARAETYKMELTELHDFGKRAIATIPESQRVLITSHDAFQYFGRAYGIEVQGIQGISTESEAGLRRINELVDLMVERKIRAVFVETSVPRKNVEAIVEGVRSRGHRIVIGGELFSDAMGPSGTYEGTYIGMLDHNITLVTRALGGDAPARGMQGKLSHDLLPSAVSP